MHANHNKIRKINKEKVNTNSLAKDLCSHCDMTWDIKVALGDIEITESKLKYHIRLDSIIWEVSHLIYNVI